MNSLAEKATTGTAPCAKAGDRLSELLTRLKSLDDERAAIVAEIEALRTKTIEDAPPSPAVLYQPSGAVHGRSPIQAKIALFRRLFRGRSDVFPVRWENTKSGRSGYSPVCRWRRGVCDKPKVKCSNCPNQAFIGVDDEVVERHLRGASSDGTPFVMGV